MGVPLPRALGDAGEATLLIPHVIINKESLMPFAHIMVPPNVLTVEQRQAIVKGVTDVIASVEKLPASGRPLITVLISETSEGGWGVGGHGYKNEEFPELVEKGARTDPDVPRK
jgi:4-oxalocrotonate tautomerase family enzyme